MHCLYCHSDDHPWFNCRKRPEGWNPPKKLAHAGRTATFETERALKSQIGEPGETGEVVLKPTQPTLKLGRPRSLEPSEGKSKRAAEMRDYMRKRRAKQKEGQ